MLAFQLARFDCKTVADSLASRLLACRVWQNRFPSTTRHWRKDRVAFTDALWVNPDAVAYSIHKWNTKYDWLRVSSFLFKISVSFSTIQYPHQTGSPLKPHFCPARWFYRVPLFLIDSIDIEHVYYMFLFDI